MKQAIGVKALASFVALAAIMAFSLAYLATLTTVMPPAHRVNLSMEVDDINGLVAGSNILLRGVPVGKISNVGTTVKGATIDFYVEGRYPIPVDSEARLENLSALGESYINLVPRRDGGPLLRDGERISTERTAQPASVSELASGVVRVLNQLHPRALEQTINEANAALPDPLVTLPNISRASVLLRNTVADMHGSGRELLDNFQTLLENASWVGPVLPAFSRGALAVQTAWQDVSKHEPNLVHPSQGTIFTYFYRLLGVRLQGFLDTSGPDLKVLGTALRPKLNDIAGALMNLDTGQLLDNILAAVPADGTITLHLVP